MKTMKHLIRSKLLHKIVKAINLDYMGAESHLNARLHVYPISFINMISSGLFDNIV